MFVSQLRERGRKNLLHVLQNNSKYITESKQFFQETNRVFKNAFPRSTISTPSNSVSEKALNLKPSSSFSSSSSSSSSSSEQFPNSNNFISWYLSILNKRPLLTKSITTCGIFGLGDLTSQTLAMDRSKDGENKNFFQRLDSNRTLRMCLVGLLISGPTLHLWFNFMAKILPSTDFLSSFKKMVIGQLIYGPSFNSAFFSFNGLMQGESKSEIIGRLKRDLLPTLKSGLLFWPACDVLTFRFAPVHLQARRSHTFSHSMFKEEHGELAMKMMHPFSFQQRRHYIQLRTNLAVADNSGAKRVQCIQVLKGAKPNAAGLGDIIIASVKEALPRGKVKKGEVVTCVVVRAGMLCTRTDGSRIRFDDNAAVIINKAGEPLGTRVFGPVPHELREKNMLKILALAQHVI